VRLDRPGQLVVLEGYAPGWRARVDGLPAPVAAGNGIFLTVPLGKGEHRVELAYRPPSVLLGLAISGATLAAVALGLGVPWARSYSSS
jgi:lipoteichoic acid glycosylation protein